MRALRTWLPYVALAAIVAAGSLLRLHHLGHGLPYSYHADEALHFTTRAMEMFGGDLNPHYLENPSAFTYLLYTVLRLLHGGGPPFDDVSGLLAAYRADPSIAYETGRAIAVVLCMLGVLAVFLVGRRLWNPATGVVAAAVLAFAFLTVSYSRYALTDTGVLLPVAVAVYAAVRAHDDGRLRWYAVAGAAVGLAVGFKYTAGLVGVPLLAAALLRRPREWRALAGLALSGVAAVAVFFLTTPYFFLDLSVALDQLGEQSDAASVRKLGQGEGGPVGYYLGSLTWGFGTLAALAAAAGLVLEARRDRARAFLLALFPLIMFVYLCTAGRHFARWLMPVYPVLALLAGVALVQVADVISRRPPVRAAVLGVLLAAVLAQPLAADIRTARMFGREDTRQLTRDFLLDTLPRDARVVVEPGVPSRYFDGRLTLGFRAPPRTLVAGGTPQRFILSLVPSRIDAYRRSGYCTVVVISTVAGRAMRDRIEPAAAYYRRLRRESRIVFHASPYKPGTDKPDFHLDWSTHLFLPAAYVRPGPEVTVHRLAGCRQQVGGRPAVLAPPPGLPRPDPASLD
ncbi:MAG: hypothetical protein AVDCRST_MAG38-1234 [uncultured Solirubrobacteraceae bacterium]|uniref:Glycosyltransferase RgtA/B/C/D-like domain-containing protein n=1 Tax=uncultured Solirubrobacteraceae bacterium TaxID=1162706 RepID=A0A6J4RG18_9ACTN|nr:MAG: hypothetical protein AVDCRST_MAG38-1234 [uncultured Solirubrobacteraceae bacterium]